MSTTEVIANALANARGMRRGAPPIVNVLQLLPDDLREEFLDDARAVERALENAGPASFKEWLQQRSF